MNMKKRSTLIIPMFAALAFAGMDPVNAQVGGGESCDGLSVDIMWGCEASGGWASVDQITGAVAPTTIEWSTGANGPYIPELASGSYWVMVTDAEGCWVKEDFNIYCDLDPDCAMDAVVEWGCLSPTSGWASVGNITGTTGPTSILWSTGETSQYVAGLPNGEHWVMVLNAEEDCWVKKMFTVGCYISPDCELGAYVDQGCLDTTSAWASVNITGATGTTSILWSTGETVQYVTGLTNGDHWVMVSEAEDCWVKTSFTVACEMDPDCPLEVDVDHGCEVEGEGWASIVELVGANEDTEIHWSTGENTMSINDLYAGSYYLVILNSENCWLKHHFEIECEADMECDMDAVVDWGCVSTTAGYASVINITGATGNVSYLWSTGETSEFVTDLPNGSHWVTITDSEGCWVKKEFSVNCWLSPDCELGAWVDQGCFDTTSAWASVNITGSSDVTSILWSTGETVQYVTGLPNGDHWVMVSEADDCWVKTSFTIDCEMDPDCPLEVVIDHGCVGDGPGWASVENILGMTDDTEVHWSTGDTTMSISGLENGMHYVVVMNSETCWAKQHFDIECMGMNIQSDAGLEVLAFPMPATNILNLEIMSMKSGVISFIVMDAMGRTLMTQGNESFKNGQKRHVTLNVDQLDNGSYMLGIVRDGMIVKTERVVIAR